MAALVVPGRAGDADEPDQVQKNRPPPCLWTSQVSSSTCTAAAAAAEYQILILAATAINSNIITDSRTAAAAGRSQDQTSPRARYSYCRMTLNEMRGIAVRSSNRRKAFVVRAFLLALSAELMASSKSCFATSRKVGHELHVHELHVEDIGPVNVYVYEDPVFDEAAVIQCFRDSKHGVAPWQDESANGAQNTGEIWLHQSLLSHPWRVLDPEDADVFFVPIYTVLNAKVQQRLRECDGLSSQQRATRSIMHLVTKSPYFNRFGGADHVVVCASWNCGRAALDPRHRMILRRAVVGINEKLDHWSAWGCLERMVTCLLYTSPSPRDRQKSRMPSSA